MLEIDLLVTKEGELVPAYDFNRGQCCSTELTIVDIKHMEKQIEELCFTKIYTGKHHW